MRRALIPAFLLLLGSVVLGATVFRDDIARATGLAQSVTVNNTAANPVPVKEQNLDGNQNVKVHEQGTANVNVTNTVPVHEQGTVEVTSANEEVAITRQYYNAGSVVCGGALYTVPAGKQLVVEYVSSRAYSGGSPQRAVGEVGTVSPSRWLYLPYQRIDEANFLASAPIHFAFPAGSELIFNVGLNAGTAPCLGEVSLGGHLQPMP